MILREINHKNTLCMYEIEIDNFNLSRYNPNLVNLTFLFGPQTLWCQPLMGTSFWLLSFRSTQQSPN